MIRALVLIQILWCAMFSAFARHLGEDGRSGCLPAAAWRNRLYCENAAFTSIRSQLLELRRRIYDLKKSRVDELILKDLLELESRRTGEPPRQILKRTVDEPSRVEGGEIDEYMRLNLELSWWKRFWIRPQIRALLRDRKVSDHKDRLLRTLRLRHPGRVSYAFGPPPPAVLRPSPERSRPFLGNSLNPLAVVTVFSDYRCSQCKGLTRILKGLVKHYRGRVIVYFHDFPLSEAAQSIDAAIASDMAFRKGKYLQMHSLLYQSQSDLTRDRILQLGARCGIAPEELAAALSSEANRRKVSKEYRAGRSVGVRATPTVLIGGRSILGRRDLSTYVRRVAELIQDRMLAST